MQASGKDSKKKEKKSVKKRVASAPEPQAFPQEACLSQHIALPFLPLQEARLKRSWSVEEVAQKLCLRVSIIQALEEERWGYFSYGPAYVLGFIQAYGKLVEWEIHDVIERFRAFQEQLAQKPAFQAAEPEKEELTPHKPTSLLFWFSLSSSLLMTFFLTPFFHLFQPLDIKECLQGNARPLVSRERPSAPPLSQEQRRMRVFQEEEKRMLLGDEGERGAVEASVEIQER